MSSKKTIVIVDDHPLIREGLKALISASPKYEVIGEAATGAEGLSMAQDLKPDLIVMDLSLPDQSGIELARQIKCSLPKTVVMIVSMHSKTDFIVKAFQAGATGYIVKECTNEKLLQGIESVLDGEYFMDSAVSHKVVEEMMQTPPKAIKIKNNGYNALTAREQEVFVLLAEGLTNNQIADRLFISLKTVKNHRARVMEKIGIHSVHELIRFAARLGLIDLDLWKE